MVKVILGAGNTTYSGWLSTQANELNLLRTEDFYRLFIKEDSVDIFLAEHVFEHLTIEEGIVAAKNIYQFLKKGGHARIAVPDRYFNNEWYFNMCKPGGSGDARHPAYTHKVFYDYLSLSEVFVEAGFSVDLLEYCDEEGQFHSKDWKPEDGMVGRSLRFDSRNSKGKIGMVSLILDAYKNP